MSEAVAVAETSQCRLRMHIMFMSLSCMLLPCHVLSCLSCNLSMLFNNRLCFCLPVGGMLGLKRVRGRVLGCPPADLQTNACLYLLAPQGRAASLSSYLRATG